MIELGDAAGGGELGGGAGGWRRRLWPAARPTIVVMGACPRLDMVQAARLGLPARLLRRGAVRLVFREGNPHEVEDLVKVRATPHRGGGPRQGEPQPAHAPKDGRATNVFPEEAVSASSFLWRASRFGCVFAAQDESARNRFA